MKKVYILTSILLLVLISGCATYTAKIPDGAIPQVNPDPTKTLEQVVYLIGDAGGAKKGESTDALTAFQQHIDGKDTKNSYTIFLGDNIYEKGLPKKGSDDYELMLHRLKAQTDVVIDYDGEVVFIPGNHDWYSGLGGLKRQEDKVNDLLKRKNAFQPEDGCPIEKIDVTDDIVIIAIDTEWYITDWDKHPTMNDECEIKSRNDFFIELEGELKKNNEKTIILAMHHPAMTYGPHGGAFHIGKHLFPFQSKIPLPGLASLIAQVRSQGGVSPADRYNKQYNALMKRLLTLAQGNDRIVLASGHEHSLQYIELDGVKQIVSGSGAKVSANRSGEGSQFAYGGQGFAELRIYTDGSSEVEYFSAEEGRPASLFSTVVHPAPKPYNVSSLPDQFDTSRSASAYTKEATDKTDGYAWFWGDHYRYVYGTDIKVPVATLDTLNGGYTIERKGGGHQTRSLRLLDAKGRNFALRAVKKSAVQFLQTVAFRDTYVEDDFRETLTENLILDFYTSSHPYATFVVGPLADAIDVYHTNPTLLYIPKHKALEKYNSEFGDELYIIEERPDDGFLDVTSFGKPDAIESTSDVLKKLRKDEKYRMDEAAFIRARLFDMLLGDWDRHQDQWRWSRFDISKDEVVYRPIPRDRDQVFSNYDGALLDVLKAIMPPTRQFQTYDGELKDIKWINLAGIRIDRVFTQNATRELWIQQAEKIQQQLTPEIIDAAFAEFPLEVQDDTANSIKQKFIERKGNLADIAGRYYDYLSKLVVLTGTDKDDYIEITRGDNTTTVSISRIKDGGVQPPFKQRVLKADETRELWIYGLDDDDQFVVNGKGNNPIFTRVIGGQNNDSYTVNNGRALKVYDHKSKPNTIVKRGGAAFRLNDIYSNNTYDYAKNIMKTNAIVPSIGFNPDDGIQLGIQDTYTVKGFKEDPFHRKHTVRAGYYFATQGFDAEYNGEFANTFGNWNLLFGAHFTSDNFTRNFFGFGNETVNMDDDLDLDFNRVKMAQLIGRIGVVKDGLYGGRIAITAAVENIEVDATPDRFTTLLFGMDSPAFDNNTFGNVDVTYSYASADRGAAPTRGMFFVLKTGVRTNFNETDNTYGYIHPSLVFYNALTPDKKLVLKTMAQGQFNLGDQFEFFQAAVLGANTGLRGYRTQRFSGQSALAFGGDLRYHLAKFKTGLLPLQLGIYGGADVGRVWIDGEDSDIWNNSVGGGLWINAVDMVSGQFGLFNSDDGLRFSFGFGFSI